MAAQREQARYLYGSRYSSGLRISTRHEKSTFSYSLDSELPIGPSRKLSSRDSRADMHAGVRGTVRLRLQVHVLNRLERAVLSREGRNS